MSPDLIRAWEKRHGAVAPERSATRRRLYTDLEIERLRLLRQVTRGGRRISDVAGLSTVELRELVQEDLRETAASPRNSGRRMTGVAERSSFEACLQAARDLDPARLELELARAAAVLGIPELIDGVLVPLLEELGEGWRTGRLRIYHEHLATALVRSLLESLRASLLPPISAPTMIVTTPSGQVHELGALTVAVLATADGWRATYLGPELPVEEIAGAALRRKAGLVAISLTLKDSSEDLLRQVEILRELLPVSATLMIGGRAAAELGDRNLPHGVIRPGSIRELRAELARLREESRASDPLDAIRLSPDDFRGESARGEEKPPASE